MCVVLPDCWTALGYSQGTSTRKRRLLSKDVSHTWWAGHESNLEKAKAQPINSKRMRMVEDTIGKKQ